jgi:sec-independent protein translocase protein TatA
MFGSFGPTEILLIFLIVLLVFGARRIPEIAQGLGKGIREFRKAAREVQSEINMEDTLEDKDSDDKRELKG